MARLSAAARRASEQAAQVSALAALGLTVGEEIRFRRPDRARWQTGVVRRLERDGSIGLTDTNGSARAVGLASLSVRARPRRADGPTPNRWEPLADRVARTEQLCLAFGAKPPDMTNPGSRPQEKRSTRQG